MIPVPMCEDRRQVRIEGLDTLRALAIMLVFAYHYEIFVAHAPAFGWFGKVGWIGVDLFFVLSGYLIGNGLLQGGVDARRFSLRAFYARRFLRTLPSYYVVLLFYFLFPAAMGEGFRPPLWRFLTFTQNVGLVPGTLFSHAWSLCVEEQFYLLFPMAVLLVARIGKPGAAVALLAAVLVAGMAIRVAL